ncbi:MAG TPA: hypothetical protein VHG89_10880 [Verrucomicrobiae bacterium]|nr:hypothetical protein [Verrucomicrobiae bacterium]
MRSKFVLCLALVLSGGSIYCLTLLFSPRKLPPPTHERINLSNGGVIYIDCTNVPPKGLDSSDVDGTISYKSANGAIEHVTDFEYYAKLEASGVAAYITDSLVVLIIHDSGGVPYVRTKEGAWKTFGMDLYFPSTNDFSAEDIKLMGITSQMSLPADQQHTVSTEIESFDPQTRIFVVTYQGPFERTQKRLRLQLSEDGEKLKLLDMRDEKFPTP